MKGSLGPALMYDCFCNTMQDEAKTHSRYYESMCVYESHTCLTAYWSSTLTTVMPFGQYEHVSDARTADSYYDELSWTSITTLGVIYWFAEHLEWVLCSQYTSSPRWQPLRLKSHSTLTSASLLLQNIHLSSTSSSLGLVGTGTALSLCPWHSCTLSVLYLFHLNRWASAQRLQENK